MFIVGVVGAVVAVGLLIVVHELGHFLACRWVGVRVERFSMGFGPPLLRWKPRATEYVLSAIPLGGYVKMAGDEPGEVEGRAPDEFFAQSPGRRAVIIVAGVVMNAILALVCFIIAFQMGVTFPKAEVGQVVVGGPADVAGLQPGDEIVAVGGWHDVDFYDVHQLIALSDPKTGVDLVVRRAGREHTVRLFPRYSPNLGRPAAGFEAALSLTIDALVKGFPAEGAGLRSGDRVAAVDGVPMQSWSHLYRTVQEAGERELALTAVRRGKEITFQLTPQPTFTYGLGASPEDGPPVIDRVGALSPAERAGLRQGDRVTAVAGARVEFWSELARALSDAESGPLELAVDRQGKLQTVTVEVPAERIGWYNRIGVLGQPPVIGEVKPGGPADVAGLRPGVKVVRFGPSGGEPHSVTYWEELEVEAATPEQRTLVVRSVADGVDVEVTLTPERGEPTGRYLIGIQPKAKTIVRKAGFFGACRLGWNKSLLTAVSVYQFLRRVLFTRTVSSGELGGPILIGYLTYKTAASASWNRLLYLLGVLGINLVLVNLLPIPILDGGHLAVIGVEKLKGSPVSPRALALAQYIGLTLIISLFLLLTYNDITNHLRRLLGG